MSFLALTKPSAKLKIWLPSFPTNPYGERRFMKSRKPAKENKTADKYTVTEVGTMLESINDQIKIVAEGHEGLDKRLERVETEIHGNSRRLDMLELSSSVVKGKVSHLEDALSRLGKELKAELTEVRTELKSEIAGVKTELKSEIAEVKAELKADIRELGDRLTSVESHG